MAQQKLEGSLERAEKVSAAHAASRAQMEAQHALTMDRMQARVDSLAMERDQAEARCAAVTKELQQFIKATHEQADDVTAERSRIHEREIELSARCSEAEAQASSSRVQMNRVKAELERNAHVARALEDQISNISAKHDAELEEFANMHTHELEVMNHRLMEREQQATELEALLGASELELARLHAENERRERSYQEHQRSTTMSTPGTGQKWRTVLSRMKERRKEYLQTGTYSTTPRAHPSPSQAPSPSPAQPAQAYTPHQHHRHHTSVPNVRPHTAEVISSSSSSTTTTRQTPVSTSRGSESHAVHSLAAQPAGQGKSSLGSLGVRSGGKTLSRSSTSHQQLPATSANTLSSSSSRAHQPLHHHSSSTSSQSSASSSAAPKQQQHTQLQSQQQNTRNTRGGNNGNVNLNSLSLPSKSSRLSSLAPLAPLNSHRAHGKPASAAPVSLARPAAKEEEAFEVEADESDAEDYDDAFDVDIEDETEGELNASSISANTLDMSAVSDITNSISVSLSNDYDTQANSANQALDAGALDDFDEDNYFN